MASLQTKRKALKIVMNGIRTFSKAVNRPHVPVMVKEVMEMMNIKPGQVVLDMTFGAGGHSRALLDSIPDIKIIALDRDPIAHEYAQELKQDFPNVVPLLGRFTELPMLLRNHNIRQKTIDAVLLDAGCSSMQFDEAHRGFSISKDGPLDMRMDGWRCPDHPTAADVLAQACELDLIRIFKVYGEEKQYRKIARAIIEARYTFTPLKTTHDLCNLVETVCGGEYREDMIQRKAHIATKVFQALRIFINNEVNELNYAMLVALKYLKIGGVFVGLTFHSIEDTIVKRHILGNVVDNAVNPLPLKYSNIGLAFGKEEMQNFVHTDWQQVNKHVMVPSFSEVEDNPRCRSAKLRCAIRVS